MGFIINVSTDLASSRASIALAERYTEVYAAVGFHPHDATTMKEGDIKTLAQLAKHPRVVAIGEIGLDFHGNRSPRQEQLQALLWQLDLARELDLPVLLHCRDAQAELLDILKSWAAPRRAQYPLGTVHCFNGDLELARRYLELGLIISIAGPVTYPNAGTLVGVVRQLPAETLVGETDCPFLTPHPYRRRKNEPAYVARVVEKMAEIRSTSFASLAQQTTANARRMLRLPNS